MTSSREKFHADLAAGEKGERHVAHFLKKQLRASSVSIKGKGKHFDFTLVYPNKTESVEVKTDFMAQKTGNLYMEFACNDKDSGLAITTADYWAVLVPHKQCIFLFCPKTMLSWLKTAQKKIIKGGDRKAVWGFVVSIEDVEAETFVKKFDTRTRLTGAKIVV